MTTPTPADTETSVETATATVTAAATATGTAAEPALVIENLIAGYRGVPAIRGVNLRVDPGNILALLGPNGAGKTTTLLAAAGLLTPLSGTVTALGAPVSGRVERTARAGVSLIPDDRGLFHRLTVTENLRLAGGRDELDQALERFPQLRPLLRRRCGLLSGGEQQSLAIARTLMRKPRVLLIDELSMGLSPIAIQAILPTLRQLADETNLAIVLVEQHIDQALSIADSAVVLHHGSVALSGPAAALREDRQQIQRAYFGR
ncbi:branched-chain amino acid transport system ATP-binding protein [Parafrankia irregularis]|uniref:Branched-chain amino acid transport system ATP-binding protein n=1 Tax=Parafrankia irregularis TaxID=795642 RepID=A0A0S4QT85_9ACTN|nr:MULTISPECIES: ABC transporter ATP-binding protein [Parafrankia]CUU58056.1 branched-chain amino acid transport system ATP-binding protein [Parafrankia irregularis]